MREILFRAKIVSEIDFTVYGYYFKKEDDHYIFNGEDLFLIYPETLEIINKYGTWKRYEDVK